jgi:hypothetical protein
MENPMPRFAPVTRIMGSVILGKGNEMYGRSESEGEKDGRERGEWRYIYPFGRVKLLKTRRLGK